MRERTPRRGWASLALVALLFLPGAAHAAVTDTPFGQSPEQRVAALAAVPAGFDDRAVISGLTQPVAVRFAADGTVFVAEKRGVVKRFSNLSDVTAETVVDVRGATHDYWDRGLIGLAVDPSYPARPYVYVSYAWDRDQAFNDGCGDPTGQGCVVSGRIVRVNANTGAQTVLVEDYCQQFPSHSVGGLAFGQDGALYASGGDGASFNYADDRPSATYSYNPCGDPWREGGSIRSQDLRTGGDPLGLDGTIVRLDPDTPLAASQRASRIVAQGLRNPFRIAIRPGTSEVWSADVGWNNWEEINRLTQPVANYGWPCYEGAGRLAAWDALNNDVCEDLYAEGSGAHAAPYYAYSHSNRLVPNETCPTGTSSISGLAFYDGGTFPAEYDGALFLADYARRCVWAMLRGANGLPDKTKIRTFITSVPAVDIQAGPGGDLFYVDISGAVRRVRATNNTRPVAVATATPSRGPLPLHVRFDGRGSSDPDDPDGTALRYEWDFTGDGSWDATGASPEFTYTTTGAYTARLRVSDPSGLDDIALVPVNAGVAPDATISTPPAGETWEVGDVLAFSGSATSATGGTLPASALSWQLVLHHCPRHGCHVHPMQTWTGVSSGSVNAPDHEYPAYLELRLSATDGVSTTVSRRLDPRTSRVRVETEPAGLEAFLGADAGPAPLSADVIVGSATAFGVATPQHSGGRAWTFAGWADGGGASRSVVAGAADATYTATFSSAAELGAPPPVPAAGGVLPGSSAPPTAWRLDPRRARLRGAARVRGRALVFGGRGDVATATVDGIDLSRGFTASAWVRRARGATGRASVVSGQGFALGVRSGTTRWRRGGVRADAGVRPGRWARLALSWDGRRARVAVDGRVVARRRVATSAGVLRTVRIGGGGFAGRVAQVTVRAAG